MLAFCISNRAYTGCAVPGLFQPQGDSDKDQMDMVTDLAARRMLLGGEATDQWQPDLDDMDAMLREEMGFGRIEL